ncbi:MAG: class I SAM-dependent methyltransferase [Nanoarchaeota archaeon]
MKNRYDDKLRKGNQLIIKLTPANQTLRIILALEIQKAFLKNKNLQVLELGCGEGDALNYILEFNSNLKVDALDISQEMIKISKGNLQKYKENLNFICKDALEYLKESKTYDLVTASWTLHNFNWKNKIELLKNIFEKLNHGGSLMIMDKIYTNDSKINKKLFEKQNKRYEYLDEELSKEIVSHEKQDYSDDFIMTENQIIQCLKHIGFSKIRIIDRIERDVVLIGEKYF